MTYHHQQQQQHPMGGYHQPSFPTYQQQQYAIPPQGASGTGSGQQPQQHMNMQPPAQQFATFQPTTFPGHPQQQYHQQQPPPGLGYYGAPPAPAYPQVPVTVPQSYANPVQASTHMMQSPQAPPPQQPQMHPQFHATPPAQGSNGQQAAMQSQQPQAMPSQPQAMSSQPQPQAYPQPVPYAPLPQPAVDSQVSVLQNIASNLMQQYAQLQHQIVTLQQQSQQQPPASAYLQNHPASFAPPNQTFGAPPNSQPSVLPQFQPNQASTVQQSQNEAQAEPNHVCPVRTPSTPRRDTPQSSIIGRGSRSSNLASSALRIKAEIPLVDLSDSPEPVHEETWTSKLSASDISMEHEESKPTSSKRSEENQPNENQPNENPNENQRGKKRRRSSGIRGYLTPDVAPADDLHCSFMSEGRTDEEDDKVYGIPRTFAVPILKSIRNHRELWDPKHPNNRKLIERRKAYDEIAATYPSFTVDQLRFFWDRMRVLYFHRGLTQKIMGVDKCHLDFLSATGIDYQSRSHTKQAKRSGRIGERVATALLTEIEKDEVVWNPDHPKYGDFDEKHKSFQRIQRKFPKLTVNVIKHFFFNIRYRYIKKLRDGDVPDFLHSVPRSCLKFLERLKDHDFMASRVRRRFATAETEEDVEEDEEMGMDGQSEGDEETPNGSSSNMSGLRRGRSLNSTEEHAEAAMPESTISTGRRRVSTTEFSIKLLPRIEKWEVLWKRDHPDYGTHAARRAAWKAVASDFPQHDVEQVSRHFTHLRCRYKKYVRSGEDGDVFDNIPRPYLRFLDGELQSELLSKRSTNSAPKMAGTSLAESEMMRMILPEIQTHQVLWDVDNANYYALNERDKAWNAIQQIYPMFQIPEMRRAFMRFRCQYLRCLRNGFDPERFGRIPRSSLRFLDRFKDFDFNKSFRTRNRRNRDEEEEEDGDEEADEAEHETNWSDGGKEGEEDDVSSELGVHLGVEATTDDDCSGDEEAMMPREEGRCHEDDSMARGRMKKAPETCTKNEEQRSHVDAENVLGDLAEPEEDALDMRQSIHGKGVVPLMAEADFQSTDTGCKFDKLKNEEIWRPTGDDAAPSVVDARRPAERNAEPVLTITCCDIPTKTTEMEYAIVRDHEGMTPGKENTSFADIEMNSRL